MRWFETQRIKWLEERLEPFNRADLQKHFDISTAQASVDINKYVKLNPGIWNYNASQKRYERKESL